MKTILILAIAFSTPLAHANSLHVTVHSVAHDEHLESMCSAFASGTLSMADSVAAKLSFSRAEAFSIVENIEPSSQNSRDDSNDNCAYDDFFAPLCTSFESRSCALNLSLNSNFYSLVEYQLTEVALNCTVVREREEAMHNLMFEETAPTQSDGCVFHGVAVVKNRF